MAKYLKINGKVCLDTWRGMLTSQKSQDFSLNAGKTLFERKGTAALGLSLCCVLHDKHVGEVVEDGGEHEPLAAFVAGFCLTEELTGYLSCAVLKEQFVDEATQVGMACAGDAGHLYHALCALPTVDGLETAVVVEDVECHEHLDGGFHHGISLRIEIDETAKGKAARHLVAAELFEHGVVGRVEILGEVEYLPGKLLHLLVHLLGELLTEVVRHIVGNEALHVLLHAVGDVGWIYLLVFHSLTHVPEYLGAVVTVDMEQHVGTLVEQDEDDLQLHGLGGERVGLAASRRLDLGQLCLQTGEALVGIVVAAGVEIHII